MIDILQSVSWYCQNTTQVDPLARAGLSENPNLATRVDCTPLSSTVTAGSVFAIRDDLRGVSDPSVTTFVNNGPTYIGLSWATAQTLDALVWYQVAHSGTLTVKVQTSTDGASWTDVSDWVYHIAATGGLASRLHLPKSVTTRYIRVLYVSATANTFTLTCTELQAFGIEMPIPAPPDWPFGQTAQFLVLHPSVRFDAPDATKPLVTVEGIETLHDDPSLGGEAIESTVMVWLTVYAPSSGDDHPEDTAQRLARWVRVLLATALAPDTEGRTRPGLPLMGVYVPLQRVVESEGLLGGTDQVWWQSPQRDWMGSDAYGEAIVITVNGAEVTPSATDLARGRVQVTAAPTDDVRATFGCGVWEFAWTQDWAGKPEGIDAIRERHGVAFRLEARSTRRALWNAIA